MKPSPKKGKKKDKKKDKKKKTHEDDVMHFVDKAFYELHIIDLNRKLARQRARAAELEQANMKLTENLGKQDEDSKDIIGYLKRNLTERNHEVTDLQTQIIDLTELNKSQQQKHEETIENCRKEYKEMQEQLTTEKKLLITQLNALDDYRVNRNELMRQFEAVHKELDAQQQKYQKEIYQVEKKAVMDRGHMKQEMQERVFNLAKRFQDANETRIAASSHRIVRENIAMSHEMNNLVMSTKELDYENTLIKREMKNAMLHFSLLETENQKLMNQYSIQSGVVKELTSVNMQQINMIENYEIALRTSLENKRKLQQLYTNEEVFVHKVKVLQNRVNSHRYAEKDLETQLKTERNLRIFLDSLITNTRLLIQSMLIEHPELRAAVDLPNQRNLFDQIIDALFYNRDFVGSHSPPETVSSVATGDFEPQETKDVLEAKPPIRQINASTTQGASFEDFTLQKSHPDTTIVQVDESQSLEDMQSFCEESKSSTSNTKPSKRSDGSDESDSTISFSNDLVDETEFEELESDEEEEEEEEESSSVPSL